MTLKMTAVTTLMKMRRCAVVSTGIVLRVSLGVKTTSASPVAGVVTTTMTVGTSLMKKIVEITNVG